MSDSLFIILVVGLAIGAILGLTFALQTRVRHRGTLGNPLPPLDRTGRRLWWIARILVGLMALSILGAFAYRSLLLVGISAACLFLYILDGLIYRLIYQPRK